MQDIESYGNESWILMGVQVCVEPQTGDYKSVRPLLIPNESIIIGVCGKAKGGEFITPADRGLIFHSRDEINAAAPLSNGKPLSN